jgi:hypothetical protein
MMGDEVEEKFTKIVVNLPNAEDGVAGEGLWSVALGNDLYEVRNSPWHSREINFCDVVRAIAPDPSKNPVFQEVERRGGHRTVQVVILEAGQPAKEDILASLKQFGATYEGMNSTMFSFDFDHKAQWQAALDYLQEQQVVGSLEHRTSAY